ncbi:MAG: SLC13 family permease [Pirellulales bacterium]
MGWQAWFTLAVLALVFGLLVRGRVSADLILIGGVVLLLLAGILTPAEALAGMANEGMITVAVLFIVSAGVVETGGITWVAERLFGRPKSAQVAVFRLMAPTALLSGFMNNTPLVAMLIPAVNDWAKKLRIAPSKVMMPLSIAAILGGTCSLIGTSTNLVVNGLVIKAAAEEQQKLAKAAQPGGDAADNQPQFTGLENGLEMFSIAWVGIPSAILGICFVVGLSKWLLPDRRPPLSDLSDPRQYTIEMMVEAGSPLVGKTIEGAGLRHLQGVFLAEIDREELILPAVSPQERLRAGDRLLFVGIVESVVELQKIRGLAPATDQVFKLGSPRSSRCLIEAVVSNTCPIVGKTIRDGRFRSTYNAAVIAVARNGQRINKKIGDIVLTAGDTLLLEASTTFADDHRNSRDFFLVSALEGSSPPSHERAVIALTILLGMVLAMTLGDSLGELPVVGRVTPLKAAMLAAGMMLFTRCVSPDLARKNVDWPVLLAIAASFALGTALEKTGSAKAIAATFIGMAGGHPWLSLAVIYLITVIVTELITNNAAAALMFPMAVATASRLNVSVMPFIIVIMMAASAGFATPIGYQTSLMVYGPGGYKFSDYVKIGVPLDLLVGTVTVLVAPFVWKF